MQNMHTHLLMRSFNDEMNNSRLISLQMNGAHAVGNLPERNAHQRWAQVEGAWGWGRGHKNHQVVQGMKCTAWEAFNHSPVH